MFPTVPEIVPLATDAARTVALSRSLAYIVVALGSVVLLYYLYAYVHHVLAEPDSIRWWYLGIGIAAGVVYGVAGLLDVLYTSAVAATFAEGATLFFILFLALGIRALYFSGRSDEHRRVFPEWFDYLVVVGFIASWWLTFLGNRDWMGLVVSVGWITASMWALFYSVLTVKRHEGTSIAALTRHLLPTILCVTIVVFVELIGQYEHTLRSFTDALWIIGTVLVGAFLFTTAVAIRQQGGEVQRMYDWTTWRQQELSVDE
ncbi:hypothetical protein [Haladaptatus sp. NG-SE-30]